MVRGYRDEDYEQLKELYSHTEWYGGQFDEARDSKERIPAKISADPESILVYENNGQLGGTVSLIEDGRVAILFRFVVRENNSDVAKALYDKAVEVIKSRGHNQVLVYSPLENQQLNTRYKDLGMTNGSDYTCFWQNL